MCKAHVDNQEIDDSTSTEPTEDDLAAFTEEDINEFSRQFLEHSNSFDTKKDLKKTEDQSEAEFFLKVLEAENKKQSAKMRDMFSSLNNSLGRLLGSKKILELEALAKTLSSKARDLKATTAQGQVSSKRRLNCSSRRRTQFTRLMIASAT